MQITPRQLVTLVWTYNAASGGWVKEGVFVTNVKIIHPAPLKGGSEKLLLWLDDAFIHLEDFAKPVEIIEGWRAGFQIIGFQRQFDVH